MKKNNLIPFSAVLLGLATFGILTLLIIFSHNLAVTITVLSGKKNSMKRAKLNKSNT